MVTAAVDAASEARRIIDRIIKSGTPLTGIEAMLNQLAKNLPDLVVLKPNLTGIIASTQAPPDDHRSTTRE